jgi:hypothetical protein
MADANAEKCAHPACACLRAKDSKYCGAYCEGIAEVPSVVCECGHDKCVSTR